MRFKNPWSTEEEIAAATREALEMLGWTVHPESCGWDLFAIAGESVEVPSYGRIEPGDTLGIECKLDAGTAAGVSSLLRQALWKPTDHVTGDYETQPPVDFLRPPSGPHFRAVVSARRSAGEIWRNHGILAVVCATSEIEYKGFNPVQQPWRRLTVDELSRRFSPAWGSPGLPRLQPVKVPKAPRIVVDVPAGVPSPQTSSKWKIAAVEATLALRAGSLTTKEIEAFGVSFSLFRANGWLKDTGRRQGRAYLWTVGSPQTGFPKFEPRLPDEQWPEIAKALENEAT